MSAHQCAQRTAAAGQQQHYTACVADFWAFLWRLLRLVAALFKM